MRAGSAAGAEVIFDKNGYVCIQGEDADYNISMIYDDDYPTDWFAFHINGENANKVIMKKTNTGYILNADNFQNVKVRANNRTYSPEVRFSTDYNEVFVYEIDVNTIGVAVDKDGNGTYETNLQTTPISVIGDFTDDNVIDGRDASALLTLYAQSSVGTASVTSDDLEKGDVNKDGILDGRDATAILTYYAKTSTGYTGTLTDFIESTKTES